MEAIKMILQRYEAMQNQVITTAMNTVQAVLIGVSRDLAIVRSQLTQSLEQEIKEQERLEAEALKPIPQIIDGTPVPG